MVRPDSRFAVQAPHLLPFLASQILDRGMEGGNIFMDPHNWRKSLIFSI